MAIGSDIVATSRHTSERSRGLKSGTLWGVALGVLVAALWFFFLRGDEPPRSIDLPAPDEISTGVEGGAAGQSGAKRANASIETFKVFAPKDPFDPLVEASAEAEATGSSSAGGRSGSTATASFDGHDVRLVQTVDLDTAQFQVDNVLYKIDINQVFAESFKLLSVEGNCASVLYGDEQVSLCEAEAGN